MLYRLVVHFLFMFLLLPNIALANQFQNPFQNKKIDFYPIPILDSFPDEGETYGINPTLQWSDPETKKAHFLLSAFAQWNRTIKFDGALQAIYYPNPEENMDFQIEAYAEFAQRFYREFRLRFFHPKWNDRHFLFAKVHGLETPFTRFFGYGANTNPNQESNHRSSSFDTELAYGYYFHPKMRITLTTRFHFRDLKSRALTDVTDTLSSFGNLPGVEDSRSLEQKLSWTFDTRKNFFYNTRGTFLEASLISSIAPIVSEYSYFGYEIEALKFLPFFNERTITALRISLKDLYGNTVPFYRQSRLGGIKEFRAFMPGRFTDKSRLYLTWEQRIKIFSREFFKVPVTLFIDPYVETGRVFNNWDDFSFDNWQVMGGIGARIILPPNFIIRIDSTYGSEGFALYTAYDYSF